VKVVFAACGQRINLIDKDDRSLGERVGQIENS